MSEQEFESYLRLMARFLRLNMNQREAISRELRAHMEDRLEDLLARGYSREEAINTALDEFGDAAALAGEFGRIGRRRKWIMRTTTATVGIAAAVLIVSFLMPQHRAWMPGPMPIQAGENSSLAPSGGPAKHAPPATQPHEYFASDESEADQRTFEQLRQVLATVDLADDTPVFEAIDFLCAVVHLPMNVDWTALGGIGIEKETKISGLRLNDVKAETVLRLLLNNIAQAAGQGGQLAYDVVDGVVRISSIDEMNRLVVVRVYDCSDLLGQSLSGAQKDGLTSLLAKEKVTGLSAASTQPNGDKLPSTPSRDRYSAEPLDPETQVLWALRERDSEAFTGLIMSMVEPDTWMPEGTVGAANVYDRLLVVRHTPRAQREVSELLAALRQAKTGRQTKVAVAD